MKILLKNEQEYDTMKAEKMDLFLLRKNGYAVAGMIFFIEITVILWSIWRMV